VRADFDEEFFTGVLSSGPSGGGTTGGSDSGSLTTTIPDTITLDGWTYAINTEQYRNASRPTLRDGVVVGGEPSDSLFDAQGAWMRYRHSWHLGMGQVLDDLGDDEATTFRFQHGRNAIPWRRGELTVAPEVRPTTAYVAGTGTRAGIARASNSYVVVDGLAAYTATNPEGPWSAVTGLTGNPLSVSSDGTTFYIGTASNLYTLAAGGTVATLLSAGNADNVAFAGNRLLVGNDNTLEEVAAGGTRTTIEQHFQSAFRWTVIMAIGSRIYVGGYAGRRSELRTLTQTSAGTFVVSAEAAPIEPGELLLNAISTAGYGVLLTSRGVRFAQVTADGTLTYGPIISVGTTVSTGIASGAGYLWFQQVSSVTSNAVIVECDLTQFASVLAPAYSVIGDDGSTESYGAMVYAGDSNSKQLALHNGIDRQVAMYPPAARVVAQQAIVRSGLVRFGTVETKVLSEIEVGFDELPAGASVTVRVYEDNGGQLATGTQAIADSRTMTVSLGTVSVRGCYVELEVNESATFVTPKIRYWRMRAYPVPPPVQQWVLPIINHESVIINDAEGQLMSQSPITVRDRLVGLWSAKTPVVYREGNRAYTVRIDDFEVQPARWTADGSYLQGLFIVRLVSA
jgi:hypothetical protein